MNTSLIIKDLLLVGSTAVFWWIIGKIINYTFTKYNLHNNYMIYVVTFILFLIIYIIVRLFYGVYHQKMYENVPHSTKSEK
jgi:hypothetical protein